MERITQFEVSIQDIYEKEKNYRSFRWVIQMSHLKLSLILRLLILGRIRMFMFSPGYWVLLNHIQLIIFDNSLLLWKCGLIFKEFILKIMLSKNINQSQKLKTITKIIFLVNSFINWSQKLKTIIKVIFLLNNFILVFLIME